MKHSYRSLLCLVLMLILYQGLLAEKQSLKPFRTAEPPKIDGKLDDSVWQTSPSVTDFKTFVPDYGKDMSERTIVYMAYDRENLYFAFRCFDRDSTKIKAAVSGRDKIFPDDWVCINLDSFNDQQALYGIYVNPLGIQGDTRYAGGREDLGFDLVWYSAGQIDDDGYTVEIRLPLKSLRFNPGKVTTMGVIFERKISRRSEQGTYPALSPQKSMAFLTQMDQLIYSNLKRYTLLELLPSFTYHQTYSRQGSGMKRDNLETDLSLTAKFGLSSRLILDGTIKPDFSQMEADAGQVDTNLRYQRYYPEKRPFFLEGKEYFDLAGSIPLNSVQSVVHTRTIADPIMGVKLSGKISAKDTISVLYALDQVPEADTSAAFSIFRYKRSLNQDAYIGFIYAGRKFGSRNNQVLGADSRFRLGPSATIDFHGLFSRLTSNEIETGQWAHSFAIGYHRLTRKLGVLLGICDLSDDFQVDTGFITRTGVRRFSVVIMPKFYPTWKWLKRIDGELFISHTKDKGSGLWETYNHLSFQHLLWGNTIFKVKYAYANEIYLQQRFETGGLSVLWNSRINKYLHFSILYRNRKAIYYSEIPFQGYENRIQSQLIFQPSDNLSSVLDFTYFDLYRNSNGEKVFDYPILRLKQTYQINK